MMFSTTHARRGAAVLVGLTASALALTGCGGSPTEGDSGNAGSAASSATEATTLVAYTGQAGDYQINFNPYSPSSIGGVGAIYEPLFFLNKAEVSDPVPLLGTEQAWNEDGTELSVTLREGVTWSDGEDFNADDVVFTFELLKATPAINTIGFAGTVEKIDDHHITFTFSETAFVRGPDILGQVIVPEHLWRDINPTEDVVEQPVGTGAFTLGDFKPQAFTFVANPDYWGGEPSVNQVRWVSLSGNQAGADGIAAGTIDWHTGPIPDINNVSDNHPGYDAFTRWQSQMVLTTCSSVDMGCDGPQTDPAVRQALYHAIGRDQLNKLAFMGTAAEISPTFALTPSQDEFIAGSIEDKVAPMDANASRARELLEGAGWTMGEDGIFTKQGERLSLTVEVVTGWTDYITAIDTITSQAKEAGIEIQAAQSSWNEWTEKKGSGNFELVIDSLWQGPVSDPFYVYQYFFESSSGAEVGGSAGNNYSRYSNPVVDEAIAALATLPLDDDAARAPHFETIQQEIVSDMPYVPILTGGTTSVWNVGKFSGWPSDDDAYAFPAVWSRLDSAEVFKRLEPQG